MKKVKARKKVKRVSDRTGRDILVALWLPTVGQRMSKQTGDMLKAHTHLNGVEAQHSLNQFTHF